jgi:3-oxoacyl-[acyl-carrier-protein] synthase II
VLFPGPQQTNSQPRVVITGAGIITAFGIGWITNAEGFRLGKVAVRPIKNFDVERQRVKAAAEIYLPEELPKTRLRRTDLRRIERAGKMLLFAAAEALEQATWKDPTGIPMVLGTTSAGMSLGQEFYRHALTSPAQSRGQLPRLANYQAQRQALDLANAFGISGQITIIANACASGANAIGHAFELVKSGRASRVLTGGYDALSQLVFAGFDSLQALSPTCCRPFDASRDGLALGEGAGILALETLESARGREARILGEVVGYAAVTDPHHLTQPQPEGEAAYSAMAAACGSCGVSPSQIDYINAHGTGTPLNDRAEAAAINRWAGDYAPRLPVSSTKASIGHLLGAAGAVEAVVCLMSLVGQWLPPTASTETKDACCNFPLITRPTSASLEYALSNSFGFGGANATLILRRLS